MRVGDTKHVGLIADASSVIRVVAIPNTLIAVPSRAGARTNGIKWVPGS